MGNTTEVIGLIYYGDGSGLSIEIQIVLQIILAVWHFLLLIWSSVVIVLSYKNRYTKLARLVFFVVLIHSLSKLISNILYIYCLYFNKLSSTLSFDVFELLSIISYYCMYNIVLFSWIEVVFRVKNLGSGEETIHFWRNIFCLFTASFILLVYIVSDCYITRDPDVASLVFGIGLIVISAFSFALSIAFCVYWVKLHKMVTSIQHSTNANLGKSVFLWKIAFLSLIFVICLDAKMIHYIINIGEPFKSTICDLYLLNYLPEAIAVTVALFFFGSKMNNDSSSSHSLSETERANQERREKKHLLSVNSSTSSD